MALDLNLYSKKISAFQYANGIYLDPVRNLDTSYEESLHDSYYKIEDESWWFQQRNRCLAAAIKKRSAHEDFFDVGGGNGFVSLMLQNELGFNTVLVEPGLQGCRAAASRGVKNVICSTFEDLELENDALSNVGLFDVLEHIEDDAGTLKNLNHKLKLNHGRLYITVPAFSWLWSVEDEKVGHFRRYNLKQLSKIVRAAGFEIEYASYFFSLLPLPIFLVRTLGRRSNQQKPNDKGPEVSDHKRDFPAVIKKIFAWEVGAMGADKKIPIGSSVFLRARKISPCE